MEIEGESILKIVRLLKTWIMKLRGLPSCEEIEQFAYAYLEGELEPEKLKNFEQHLEGCGNCLRFIESYHQVAKPEGFLS
ncbi:zf-HC2 domain-containing protein, partial [Acidobacteria bacterium AH-259-L09]|nr:zf-HC2 domain-containing protein [Acidobacteria bacterium AH-259-L09]